MVRNSFRIIGLKYYSLKIDLCISIRDEEVLSGNTGVRGEEGPARLASGELQPSLVSGGSVGGILPQATLCPQKRKPFSSLLLEGTVNGSNNFINDYSLFHCRAQQGRR